MKVVSYSRWSLNARSIRLCNEGLLYQNSGLSCPVRLGSTKKRMPLTEEIGIEKSIERISGIEYLPYIYHPKMDSENKQSYYQV